MANVCVCVCRRCPCRILLATDPPPCARAQGEDGEAKRGTKGKVKTHERMLFKKLLFDDSTNESHQDIWVAKLHPSATAYPGGKHFNKHNSEGIRYVLGLVQHGACTHNTLHITL